MAISRFKYSIGLILLGLTILSMRAGSSFKDQQLKYPRVRSAFAEKESSINELLRRAGVNSDAFEIYVRGFKQEGILELWARSKGNSKFVKLRTYPFCAVAGTLGPKRRQGDRQIPEGLYEMSGFNPNSNFHLSLKVSYPNAADRNREGAHDLGGQIFIHGGCQTIGCIPITDERIKELYVIAVRARSSGQSSVRIDIFPNKLTTDKYQKLREACRDEQLVDFWGNLRTCVTYFDRNGCPPNCRVDQRGRYIYSAPRRH